MKWLKINGRYVIPDNIEAIRVAKREGCAVPAPVYPTRFNPFEKWCVLWAREAFRVLKPGGYLLAFGGTRTWHRLAAAIAAAGFDVDGEIAWCYGSGFPKSLDVSKALDKSAGAEREVVGNYSVSRDLSRNGRIGDEAISPVPVMGATVNITIPTTTDARRWDGWGTALKPAWEPVVVARKGAAPAISGKFFYVAKAGRAERNAGLDDMEEKDSRFFRTAAGAGHPTGISLTYPDGSPRPQNLQRNNHPTVKPYSVMRDLISLVSAPGDTILDPFNGSGSTGIAAVLEDRNYVGIEREEEYVAISNARIAHWDAHPPEDVRQIRERKRLVNVEELF